MISSFDGKVYNFSYKRIQNLFEAYSAKGSENYSKAYAAWIRPLDFLSLTTSDVQGFLNRSAPLDYKELCNERQEIFLTVDFDNGEVVGHEGRHRMAALHKAGATMVAIAVRAYGEKGKYDRKFIDSVTVSGEEFLFTRPVRKASGVVELKALLPISVSEKDHVRDNFGPAVPLSTFMGKKIYVDQGEPGLERLQYLGTIHGFSDHGRFAYSLPHTTFPYEIKYVHLRNESEQPFMPSMAVPLAAFMNHIHEGKYKIFEKDPVLGLDQVIAAAQVARQENPREKSAIGIDRD